MWRNNARCLVFKSKCKIEPEQIELWADTYLLSIDEISFASKSDFKMMHKQLGKLKQEINEKFSGLNIIFSGDFWQFKPVGRGKLPLYKDDCPYFIDWVNCYILPLVQNSGYTFFCNQLIGKCDPHRICGFCTRVGLAILESHSVKILR